MKDGRAAEVVALVAKAWLAGELAGDTALLLHRRDSAWVLIVGNRVVAVYRHLCDAIVGWDCVEGMDTDRLVALLRGVTKLEPPDHEQRERDRFAKRRQDLAWMGLVPANEQNHPQEGHA